MPEVRSQTSALRHPSSDFPRAHAIAPAHFELRDDGTIGAPASGTARSEKNVPAVLEAGAPTPEVRSQTSALRPPASDFPRAHAIAPAHFELRDDGTIKSSAGLSPAHRS